MIFFNFIGVVKKRFTLTSKKFKQIWPKVRNSINAMGRLKSHQARTVAATIEAQRLADEREHERETRIVTLQREVEL